MFENKICIGLTGGIATGKSTVIQFFNQLQINSICADSIAKAIVKANSVTLKEIVKTFGKDILQANGELNREKLKSIIFEDKAKKLKLEAIMHPMIRGEIKNQITKTTSYYTVIDIPLLIDRNIYPYLDYVVSIDMPEIIQLQRLLKRDQINEKKAHQILNAQIKRAERFLVADYILHNFQSIDHLKTQVESLNQHILKRFNKKN